MWFIYTFFISDQEQFTFPTIYKEFALYFHDRFVVFDWLTLEHIYRVCTLNYIVFILLETDQSPLSGYPFVAILE